MCSESHEVVHYHFHSKIDYTAPNAVNEFFYLYRELTSERAHWRDLYLMFSRLHVRVLPSTSRVAWSSSQVVPSSQRTAGL